MDMENKHSILAKFHTKVDLKKTWCSPGSYVSILKGSDISRDLSTRLIVLSVPRFSALRTGFSDSGIDCT